MRFFGRFERFERFLGGSLVGEKEADKCFGHGMLPQHYGEVNSEWPSGTPPLMLLLLCAFVKGIQSNKLCTNLRF